MTWFTNGTFNRHPEYRKSMSVENKTPVTSFLCLFVQGPRTVHAPSVLSSTNSSVPRDIVIVRRLRFTVFTCTHKKSNTKHTKVIISEWLPVPGLFLGKNSTRFRSCKIEVMNNIDRRCLSVDSRDLEK